MHSYSSPTFSSLSKKRNKFTREKPTSKRHSKENSKPHGQTMNSPLLCDKEITKVQPVFPPEAIDSPSKSPTLRPAPLLKYDSLRYYNAFPVSELYSPTKNMSNTSLHSYSSFPCLDQDHASGDQMEHYDQLIFNKLKSLY